MTMEYTIEPCRGIAADVRLGVAACSVSESACNAGRCGPIKVIVRDFNGQFELKRKRERRMNGGILPVHGERNGSETVEKSGGADRKK